ncbi:MAG TPA: carbohydrate ABC transporter permease [Thermomicrobiales bacterium]|nr:carbohydrate ABC transporter permease [Thermomicrobiales bacterium]
MAIETDFAELEALAPATAGPRETAAGGRRPSVYLAAVYAVLVVAAVIAIVPFLYVISTSFKSTIALFSYPPEWIPTQPTLENFAGLVNDYPFIRWTLNSFIVAAAVTVIKVGIDSMAGYAFAKMDFPGKNVLFLIVLMTLMVPFAATLIPLFLIVRNLNLTNTYLGLILPPLASPIGIFMMRQFIETLPGDLEHAARLDGCSEFQIFRRIILPLIRPGLVVLGVFTFMTQWTSYLWPLVIGTKPEMFTLTVGVQSLKSLFTVNWGILSAGAVLSMLPLVIVFLFLQRYFIAGSIAGALKE